MQRKHSTAGVIFLSTHTTEKIIAKEQKQLLKLKKKQAKGNYKLYFAVILFLIAFVNIIDEVSSGLPSYVQSSIVTDFLVNSKFLGKSYSFQEGLSLHTTIGALSYVFGVVTPFYKALADKFGRKPLFAFSTFGMSLGMFVAFLSNNYIMFLIGYSIMGFFMGHDIQIIYVLEEAPTKLRARIYSVLKTLGILGTVAIPALRDLLMQNDPERWRLVFLVPALVGFIACGLVIAFAKDTKVFINERIAYLSIPYEERQELKKLKTEEAKADTKIQGVFNGIKYIFSNKDTRLLIISHMVFDVAIASVGLFYESIMHLAGLSTQQTTDALYMIPFVYSGVTLLSGFVADYIGRKKTVLIGSVMCVGCFVLFILGLNKGFAPYLIGIFAGLYQSGYWIGRDYMNIMMTEKVPTEIRASVVGGEGLLVTVGMALGYVLMIVGMELTTVANACLVIIVPCVSIAAIIMMLKVKETKGTELDEIKSL